MKINSIVIVSALMLFSTSCRSQSAEMRNVERPGTGALPRAVIYQTNINVNDNVPVSVSADGNMLVSFPGPSDIGQFSTPISLAAGWLLDRRGGIGQNTRFLTYTYDQYSRLEQLPSVSALLEHIIKDARVTATFQLDMSLQQAVADTAYINDLIRSGVVKSPPRIQVTTIK